MIPAPVPYRSERPQEHQARSVERLEQFAAARQMEALSQEQGAAEGMIQ